MLAVSALVGFAGNSLLCRAALARGSIDPVAFTVVRILAGALTLTVLCRGQAWVRGSWAGAASLFVYAIAFSLAYVRLPAGAGALALFGVVQCTMLGWALWVGERPGWRTWVGWWIAVAGLGWLLLPSASAAGDLDLPSLGLMAVAGVAWAVYTLLGRGATRPLEATAGNFLRATPLIAAAAALYLLPGTRPHATLEGLGWAVASGSIASGLGYACWFGALGGLSRIRAAVLQLTVPVVAAALGIALLGEALSFSLLVSSGLVLGGVGLTLGRPAPAGAGKV